MPPCGVSGVRSRAGGRAGDGSGPGCPVCAVHRGRKPSEVSLGCPVAFTENVCPWQWQRLGWRSEGRNPGAASLRVCRWPCSAAWAEMPMEQRRPLGSGAREHVVLLALLEPRARGSDVKPLL